MSALDKLKLMENTRRTADSTPEGQARARMVEAINQQIAAAEAMQRGESFQVRRQFWGKDADPSHSWAARIGCPNSLSLIQPIFW